GWYEPGQGASLIGATVGAIILLVIWGMIAKRRA
ncbi:MAG: GlsB/YeaQ/YmgE family stress response membrane protein, partial [Pseudorhodoplanes sp.]|nr:GlsB/YeaQ/YmgE family stress response membrane protein [Pseudorhodoplanes sp.]